MVTLREGEYLDVTALSGFKSDILKRWNRICVCVFFLFTIEHRILVALCRCKYALCT
jgi:hypothetical protein